MRRDLLIASLIVIILGFVISGIIGSILLGVGILLLIYVLFSQETQKDAEARYIEPEYAPKATPRKIPPTSEKKSTARYIEEPKPKYKNVNRAQRELKAWDSGSAGKRCSSCGSTSNPSNAKFCADCGKEL